MKKILYLLLIFPFQLTAQTANDELVEIKELIPDIVLDIKYSTTDNFTHQKLYSTNVSYLCLGAVKGLIQVQDSLRKIGLGLKIFDGYRPRAIQYLMWDIVPDPTYVANPATGSNHNHGGAVDLTIVDRSTGQEWEMGTPFDYFGPEAAHSYTSLPANVLQSRQFLKSIMTNVGGFVFLDSEWWHYDFPPASGYPLLDFQMK